MATSLNWPGNQGKVIARLLNLPSQSIRLKAGSTIGPFTENQQKQLDDFHLLPPVKCQKLRTFFRQMGTMNQDTWKDCMTQLRAAVKDQSRRLARLPRECSTVFSTGYGNVEQTTLVEHSIPLEEGTRLIRQPPNRLGL